MDLTSFLDAIDLENNENDIENNFRTFGIRKFPNRI